jgi:hypothetical protein
MVTFLSGISVEIRRKRTRVRAYFRMFCPVERITHLSEGRKKFRGRQQVCGDCRPVGMVDPP